MRVQCQVVTTPTSDTPGTCLLLHFDTKRYLLGHIGEGSQRACVERHIRLPKVSDIFLSGRMEWLSTGGLVGLILTMADQDASKIADAIALGKKKKSSSRNGITIHGGKNLMHSLATTRAFVFRRAMNLRLSEVPNPGAGEKDTPYFKDENLVVRAMKIRPEDDANPEDTMEGAKREKLPSRVVRAGSPTSAKRSFDDFTGDEKHREATLRSVVENMFCSDWSMDTMVEDADPLDAPGPSAEDIAESLPTSSSRSRSRSTSPSKRPKHTPERDPNLSTTLPPPGKTRAPWPASVVRQLPRSQPCRIALSYIVTLHPQRGKFLPGKAIELGIKPGPSFSRLAAGETLTAPNGNIVRPEDVMEPTKPGTGIAICDLPDASYIKDFLARAEWKDIEKVKIEIGCFFWILGPGVVVDERLKAFMKGMGHAKHIVSSPDVCPNTITFQGAAKSSTKLNLLDGGYFPMPHSSAEPLLPADDCIQPAKPGLVFQIEPRWNLITESIEAPFSRGKILEETEPAYIDLAKAAREGNAGKTGEDIPWKDVEVITLGTGSALPSKYRNVSSTLVRVPGAGSVIFDAGENTLGQLKRLYSPEELEETLRDLRALYISHLHADHHLGTVAVLKAWYNETHARQPERVINVVAPWKFLVWLREYADVEDYGFSKIRFVSCEDLLKNNRDNPDNLTMPLLSEVLSSASLADIQTSRAIHCMGSFTTAWTWHNGFKIAYSGDTRPTNGFVAIGQGATVLLHEATFDDELKAEAIAKKHSTTSEAITAGKQMAAKAVVLTHFSQRYPKLPVLSKADENSEMEVIVAFDLCRVRVGDVKRFGSFIPALKELYEEAEEEEGDSELEEEEPKEPEVKAAAGGNGGAAKRKKK